MRSNGRQAGQIAAGKMRPVTSTSREPRHAIRVVEALLLYNLYLASQAGYEHSHQILKADQKVCFGNFFIILMGLEP